jgi:hypothetical protein
MYVQPPEPVLPATDPVDVALLARAQTPLDIGRSAMDVYDYLIDFSHHVEWAHTCLSVEASTPLPLRPGARLIIHEKQDLRWDKRPYTVIADRPGPRYTTAIEIMALDPAQRITWRTQYRGGPLDGVRGEWEFAVESVAEAITTLRLRAELIGPEATLVSFGEYLRRNGHPIDVLARQVDRAMHNIRTILEGRARA